MTKPATVPYENATSGDSALGEIQRILRAMGCSQFGNMLDDEKKTLMVQFTYRNRTVQVTASMAGYAALYLRTHPWNNQRKGTKVEYERKAMRIASVAVYSILRDWIKGQTLAIETGMLSFEGAFLGQILLPSGRTVLETIETTTNLLESPK